MSGRTIESAGNNREEAIQNGLKELGVEMHEVENIDILDEGSKGFLGLGKRPVRVRLTVDRPDTTARGNRGPRDQRDQRDQRNRQPRQQNREQQGRERGRGGDGRRQESGATQDKQDNQQRKNKSEGGDNRGRDNRSNETQGDGNRGGASRGSRGGKNRRGGRGGEERSGKDNRRDNAPNPVRKAAPIVDKRKSSNVSEEATEALRRAEQFDTGTSELSAPDVVDELPPNARPDDEIENISDEQGNEAAAMLSEVLKCMELDGLVRFTRASDGSARLSIESENDGGILIGKRGVTLAAIQYLINRMITRNDPSENTEKLVVDVGGYVDRRQDMLVDMARAMARRAKESRRNVRLKPLSPQERRIVHLALEKDPQVRTYSLGDSLFRSIVINPVGAKGGEPRRRDRQERKTNATEAEPAAVSDGE